MRVSHRFYLLVWESLPDCSDCSRLTDLLQSKHRTHELRLYIPAYHSLPCTQLSMNSSSGRRQNESCSATSWLRAFRKRLSYMARQAGDEEEIESKSSIKFEVRFDPTSGTHVDILWAYVTPVDFDGPGGASYDSPGTGKTQRK